MKKLAFIVIFLPILVHGSQSHETDSLLNYIKTAKFDTNKVNALRTLSVLLAKSDSNNAFNFGRQSLKLARKLNHDPGVAKGLRTLGELCFKYHQTDSARYFMLECIKVYRKINDLQRVARAYERIGHSYYNTNDYVNATTYFIESLKNYELAHYDMGIADGNMNLGNIEAVKGNPEKAQKRYLTARTYYEKLGSKRGIAVTIANIGELKEKQGHYQEALELYLQAYKIYTEIDEQHSLAYTTTRLGNLHTAKGDFDKALDYYQQSLELYRKLKNKWGLDGTYVSIGKTHYKRGDLTKALEAFNNGFIAAQNIGCKDDMKAASLGLAQTYAAQGNFQEAYKHQQTYGLYKDSILNEESSRQIAEMEAKYENEKKQLTIDNLKKKEALKKAELARKQEEINRQTTEKVAYASGLVFMIALALLILRGYRNKQKANRLISAQKEKAEHQKELVEQKNKEITDSITYAKRIQQAILPPLSLVKKYLPDSFILYKPKEIVSGDFYWLEARDHLVYFAAIDCTGHGVPGAMVSVIGHNGLERCLKELHLTEPAAILDKLTQLVEETFQKSESQVKDGMDMALCCLNTSNNTLQYAGANNPLYYISGGSLHEIKANKQPIGSYDMRKPFTNHEINLKHGDVLYLFSDGFADQFGGQRGKKFKYRPFKELLLSVHSKSPEEQHRILDHHFEQWKGDLEQIDDVCIIGVRV